MSVNAAPSRTGPSCRAGVIIARWQDRTLHARCEGCGKEAPPTRSERTVRDWARDHARGAA